MPADWRRPTAALQLRTERAFAQAALDAVAAQGLESARSASPNAPRGRSRSVRTNGRFPGFRHELTGLAVGSIGSVRSTVERPELLWVRMYWRLERDVEGSWGHKLECSCLLSEIKIMAAWCVTFLTSPANAPPPASPVPVSSHLAEYERACNYLWTAGALVAYYADPWTCKGSGPAPTDIKVMALHPLYQGMSKF